eukprot:scaffold16952_cov118-Isochrysis_galbana.AAC.3
MQWGAEASPSARQQSPNRRGEESKQAPSWADRSCAPPPGGSSNLMSRSPERAWARAVKKRTRSIEAVLPVAKRKAGPASPIARAEKDGRDTTTATARRLKRPAASLRVALSRRNRRRPQTRPNPSTAPGTRRARVAVAA